MTDDDYYENRALDAMNDRGDNGANQRAQVWALLGIRKQLERLADQPAPTTDRTDS